MSACLVVARVAFPAQFGNRGASRAAYKGHEGLQLRPAATHQAAVAGVVSAMLLLAPPVLAMDLSYAPSSVKAALEQRDEAMAYQCTGGMFDCDGDRREFAKQQWADFVAANGVPERKRGAVTAAAQAEQGPKEQPAADNNQ
ncbi:hypothetical protein ABPG77_010414 [Micractinium sp. CCAP 211/92]